MSAFVLVLGLSILFHLTQQGNICYRKGHSLYSKGKHEESIPYYVKALSFAPKNLKAQTELAYSYMWDWKFQKAIDVFSQILKEHPGDIKIELSLADCYAYTLQFDSSIALMNGIIHKTKDLDMKMHLAEIYLWAQMPQKAVELLQEILKESPGDMQVEMLLGKALYYAGDNEEASRIFEILLKQIPDGTS